MFQDFCREAEVYSREVPPLYGEVRRGSILCDPSAPLRETRMNGFSKHKLPLYLRETDDFTDIGDFAMFRCFIYIISVKYCIVMKEILSVMCQY